MDPVSAMIGGGAGLIGSALGIWGNKKSQKRAIRAQTALFNMQKDWEKEKMQNAYTWTMGDLEQAGLNPTLMMGGTGSANMAGSNAPGAVGTPSTEAPDILGNAVSAIKLSKELGLIDAKTENINADTANKQQQFELTPELTKSVINLNNSHSALNYAEKEKVFHEQINTELKNHAQEIANRTQDLDYNKRKSQYDKEMAIYISEMQTKLKELGIKDSIIYQAVNSAFDTAGKLFRSVTVNSNNPGVNIQKSTNINSPTVNY